MFVDQLVCVDRERLLLLDSNTKKKIQNSYFVLLLFVLLANMEEDTNCRFCSDELTEPIAIQKQYNGTYQIVELVHELASLEVSTTIIVVMKHQSIIHQCLGSIHRFVRQTNIHNQYANHALRNSLNFTYFDK